MDSELGLSVNWAAVKDKHMKVMHRDSRAHAQGDYDGNSRPAPWTAEDRTDTAAAAHDRWAGAIGSAAPGQWQDGQ
eukprot:6039639-Pyramimonas_sp.AAC.1